MARPKKVDIDKLREQTKAKTQDASIVKPVVQTSKVRTILTLV